MQLTDDEKKTLLKVARSALTAFVNNNTDIGFIPISSERLEEQRGVFVSLKNNGNLRGCIGVFASKKPLYTTVMEMAISAGVNDTRFPRVTAGELDDIDIEVSVLSPLEEIKDVSLIEVGRHGIYMMLGMRFRGVLLPQVAVENGWDREEFLENTCRKAGLKPGSWKSGEIRIYRFEADIFSEGALREGV